MFLSSSISNEFRQSECSELEFVIMKRFLLFGGAEVGFLSNGRISIDWWSGGLGFWGNGGAERSEAEWSGAVAPESQPGANANQ